MVANYCPSFTSIKRFQPFCGHNDYVETWILNVSLWAMGLGFFVTLLHLLEIVFSGPQGRNVIKHHLLRYMETTTATFSFLFFFF